MLSEQLGLLQQLIRTDTFGVDFSGRKYIFISERRRSCSAMPRDQPPEDVFEQDLSLPHQFLIDLFIYSQIRLVCLQSTHDSLKQSADDSADCWYNRPSLIIMAANGSRLFAAQLTNFCNEVGPLRGLLKLQLTPEFPRQSTPNNVFNQACGASWGVDGCSGHWRLFSVWLDGSSRLLISCWLSWGH